MITLQEYLNQRYPTKENRERVEIICVDDKTQRKVIASGGFKKDKLDLREFKNVKRVFTMGGLTELNVSGCNELVELNCAESGLTSINFLNELPNPEKLEELWVSDNNIRPTDISFFNKFVNLKILKIGTSFIASQKGQRNRFYGSLKSWKNLTKLKSICIEATDISEGLEYLPSSFFENISFLKDFLGFPYMAIQCSPNDLEVGCKKIQDQLKKYDYDLEAWQLAHPHLIYEARPEVFFDNELKYKWLSALRDKTTKTQSKLNETKQNEPLAVKRIKRLELKLKNLKLIQDNISTHSLLEKFQQKELVKKEGKTTQTELVQILDKK